MTSPLFGDPISRGYLESHDYEFFWLNGEAKEHNAVFKMLGEDQTRQQAWELAVWMWECDKDGNRAHKNTTKSDFMGNVKRTVARQMAMQMLGISEADNKTDFDREVEAEGEPLAPESGDSTS